MRLFKAAFANVPGVTARARHAIASIAIGSDCPPISFYRELQNDAVGEQCDSELVTCRAITAQLLSSQTLQQ